MLDRRSFLVRTGLALGTGVLAAGCRPRLELVRAETAADLQDWRAVRGEFNLSRDYIHLTGFLLASHPRPVREAIETHRRGLDENPANYLHDHAQRLEADVLGAAAEYLGVDPTEIALTDSTTMGLGLLYGGLKLREGQDILTTHHDHYSTATALRLRAERTGASVRAVSLYANPATATEEEITEAVVRALKPRTRVVAVTWVHSCTGVKLPIRRIADALAEVNAQRDDGDRALLCVDGVHGIGVDDATMAEMGCDFFVAGTHKWMFGPRGTGLLWGRDATWGVLRPTVPTFEALDVYTAWTRDQAPSPPTHARWVSPGGFHAFEHQWAVPAAFRFHQQIGRKRIADRIHALNDQCKEGLARMPHVTLYTPRGSRLSAGIVCFDVRGMSPDQVVRRLLERRIIASTTPYGVSYARAAPSILNTPAEVDTFLREVRALATS